MLFLELLFYAFLVIVGIQLLFYGGLFGNFSIDTPKKVSKGSQDVSVIICAKNEAENLKAYLPFIIDQDHNAFELILINDNSSDDTLEVMEDFKKQHDHIKIVDVKPVEKFWGNKKYALTLGIKAASNDHLLFTDADCKPISRHWISEMSAHFSKDKAIVIGYAPYQKMKGSLINFLIRFETFMTAVQYFSYAKIGLPYMGVGRNLAYKKPLFFEANGFMGHMHLRSGDDDLFINEIASKHNTAICLSKNSFTESIPKTTFKSWVLQKRRHISTAKYYKPKHKALLAVFYLSQILFWVLATVLLCYQFHWKIVLSLFIFRLVIQYTSLYLISKKLDETGIILLLPLWEILLIIFQFFIFIKNLISKPQHWK